MLRAIVILRQIWMVALLVGAAAFWFLIQGGGSVAETSRAVLHGLCAQQPTHSMKVGGELLPFDSRMTGIYSGAFLSWIVLLSRGRLTNRAVPPLSVILVLAFAVTAMAVDGFNSLFVDLGTWHLYEPQNEVRYFTGFGAGLALTSLLSWLIGSALWKLRGDTQVWESPAELIWTVPASYLVYLTITVAPGWSYPVLAMFLMASAWITVTGLVLVIGMSLFQMDQRVTSLAQLHAPLTMSALGALMVMLGLAQGRFWLERTLGIPQDFIAAAPHAFAAIL